MAVIALFGSKKPRDTARALGKSMRILKSEAKAMKETDAQEPRTDPHSQNPGTPRRHSLQGLRKHENHGHDTVVGLVRAATAPFTESLDH